LQPSSTADVIARAAAWGAKRRCIVALAGPPGSGKSTFAETLAADFNIRSPGSAAIVPMDGFHYDDALLVSRGLRSRKGAPETFDVSGFAHMIGRLRDDEDPEIAVPVFDRSIEIARAGARLISSDVRTVIVEGNYLLLDRPPWNRLEFDITVMIDLERRILRDRLIKRWLDLGADLLEAHAKVDGNDILNADIVTRCSRAPDFYLCG
jgi:pantothenate kinase